jgi:hypothetical protein
MRPKHWPLTENKKQDHTAGGHKYTLCAVAKDDILVGVLKYLLKIQNIYIHQHLVSPFSERFEMENINSSMFFVSFRAVAGYITFNYFFKIYAL